MTSRFAGYEFSFLPQIDDVAGPEEFDALSRLEGFRPKPDRQSRKARRRARGERVANAAIVLGLLGVGAEEAFASGDDEFADMQGATICGRNASAIAPAAVAAVQAVASFSIVADAGTTGDVNVSTRSVTFDRSSENAAGRAAAAPTGTSGDFGTRFGSLSFTLRGGDDPGVLVAFVGRAFRDDLPRSGVGDFLRNPGRASFANEGEQEPTGSTGEATAPPSGESAAPTGAPPEEPIVVATGRLILDGDFDGFREAIFIFSPGALRAFFERPARFADDSFQGDANATPPDPAPVEQTPQAGEDVDQEDAGQDDAGDDHSGHGQAGGGEGGDEPPPAVSARGDEPSQNGARGDDRHLHNDLHRPGAPTTDPVVEDGDHVGHGTPPAGGSGSDDHGVHSGGGSSGHGEAGAHEGGEDSSGGAGQGGGHVHSGHSLPHPDDPAKLAEHLALLELVPVSEATHVAIRNGSWFDPSTWAGGEVPADGARVVIPSGYSVSYDGESAASVFTIRVDGELDFATDRDTFLEVDTLVVTPTGTLRIGTADDPVQAGFEAVIQIADNGPIDVDWDPTLVSRGVISHGEIEIHGAEKENFVKVAADPMQGDQSIRLAEAPEGWAVGDKIVLTSTKLTSVPLVAKGAAEESELQDEVRTITRIEGDTLFFDAPLEYDHDTPRADLKAYVANQTRNVTIRSESGADGPVHHRGHVMFMHSDDIDVRYAAFDDLGRTDKSERALRSADVDEVAADTNMLGRYSLHIHRAGFADLDDPAMLVGNAVNGVVGWGIVHHDSNALLQSNNVYDVFGAGIVAESGNEVGRWSDNIVIGVLGLNRLAKDGQDVGAFDLGRDGSAFWMQSRLIELTDNVAASAPGGQGFIYFTRGQDPSGLVFDPEHTPQPGAFKYDPDVKDRAKQIAIFDNNEAIGVGIGFQSIKAGPTLEHDVRSMVTNFTAWEAHIGIGVQYVSLYTFKDIDLVGPSTPGFGKYSKGIDLNNQTVEMIFSNVNIDGFETGVWTFKPNSNFGDDLPLSDRSWKNAFIDVSITGAKNEMIGVAPDDLFLTASDLIEGRLSLAPRTEGVLYMDGYGGDAGHLQLGGVKTDSIGDYTSSEWVNRNIYNPTHLRGAIETIGYWRLEDGRPATVFEEWYSDRVSGNLDVRRTIVAFSEDLIKWGFPSPPQYNGVLDLDNQAADLVDDAYSTTAGAKIVLDVLANDVDPEGDALRIIGVQSHRGRVVLNQDDNTISYFADNDWEGVDTFRYFVMDGQGNVSEADVTVSVDI